MADTTREHLDTATLAGRTRGAVSAPGTSGYPELAGFQLLDPHRPALVVAVTDEADVRAAVGFAAERGVRIAVQTSGHGRADPLDGGVLLDTRGMSGVRVDPHARTAWVEAGASWQRVIEASAPYGLAPLSGSAPGVGAVSYTLGGGLGLLAREYGFAADHVYRIDLVTADGRLRRVSAADDADLFWALRGGGGNFGVVTGMEIGLVPVERLYGGGIYVEVDQVPDVLAAWRDWTATVPEQLTSAVAMLPFPDLPMVPEQLRGRHVAQLQIAYTGTAADGEDLVRPLRELGPIVRDTLREIPYTESGTVFDEPDRAHGYRSSNRLLSELDTDALATLPELAGPTAPVLCVVGLRHLGGALARPPRVPNAVGHRDAAYSLTVLSPIEPDDAPAAREVHRRVLAPWSAYTVGRSLNFSFGPHDAQQVREAFAPADYRRLTELTARYDPGSLLHANHAIPPADPAGSVTGQG